MTAQRKPKLLLIGLGDLGGVFLELLLAHASPPWEILVGARNVERAAARVRLLQLSAAARGASLPVRILPLDLDGIAATAETLHRERPDLVLTTATMATWWLPDLLPRADAAAFRRAGFGVWLPVHLAPTYALMQAVRAAAYPGFTVTAPYPDVVNCMLGHAGLAPTCGIGNVAELAAKIEVLAAENLGVPRGEIGVSLAAHHSLLQYAFRERAPEPHEDLPPSLLRITHKGRDITEQAGGRSLLFAPFPVPHGRVTHFLTAQFALRLAQALLGGPPAHLHVPAPAGLPGGYPVHASPSGIALALSEEETRQAVALNGRSHRYDGITAIAPDGTAVLNQESAQTLRGLLGYAPDRVSLDEARAQAAELTARFHSFAKKKGVELP